MKFTLGFSARLIVCIIGYTTVSLALSAFAATVTPVAPTTSAPAPAPFTGTNVIDDQDSSVGLFVAPWRDASATNPDRPPRLLDVKPQPVDLATQRARLDMEDLINANRQARLAGHQ